MGDNPEATAADAERVRPADRRVFVFDPSSSLQQRTTVTATVGIRALD